VTIEVRTVNQEALHRGEAIMKRSSIWIAIIACSFAAISLMAMRPGRLSGQVVSASSDPTSNVTSYVFQLKVGGTIMGEYTGCSGLGSSNDVVENSKTDTSGVSLIQKTPGVLRWHNIRLRRIGIGDAQAWNWRTAMEKGDANQAFRDGGIVVLSNDASNKWIAEWSFHRGWVASIDLNEGAEELVIVHEGLERVSSNSVIWTRP
jgi:phage tail-like protein